MLRAAVVAGLMVFLLVLSPPSVRADEPPPVFDATAARSATRATPAGSHRSATSAGHCAGEALAIASKWRQPRPWARPTCCRCRFHRNAETPQERSNISLAR